MEQVVNHDILTPINFLERSVTVYGDKTAVVYKDKHYTYREFQSRIFQLARYLLKLGIDKGDKIAFICPNTPPMLEAHYAIPLIGATLVSINIRLSANEVSYILNHSDAKVAFVDNEFANVVSPIKDELQQVKTFINICDVDTALPLGDLEYETCLASMSTERVECAVVDEKEIIALNYTSGTTGKPKGVMYHHRGAYLNAMSEVLETGINAKSVYLWTLPLFHCNGWCFSWGVTAMGGTHVCLRKVEAEEIFKSIKQEQVSHLCGAPTVLITMSSYAEDNNVQLDHPLLVTTAGAPPAPTVIQNIQAFGAEVLHVYGLTEVYGPHSVCAWQPGWDQLDEQALAASKSRQGVPMVLVGDMDVVDVETMQPVPIDGKTIGEIVMRGNNIMVGYYKNEAATQEAFKGGWFHSGDLAVMHPDNYVQILDRAKDIIISGGENISTVEVESVIFKHPSVLECAIVPTPDEKWGETPKAYVTLKEGKSATEVEIIEFCKSHLARFKAPKAVEFGPLPKTSTGKVQKFKLREQEWQGKERRVN